MNTSYQPGIDVLLDQHADWLAGRRIGLVAHPASLSAKGAHATSLLRNHPDMTLSCLFGPEHGLFGGGEAGEKIRNTRHPEWDIPIYSLHGARRKPSGDMMEGIDTLVVDLQDLGVRCYTYVSTLRYVLEAAAEFNKPVVIADRPIPLAQTIDGPMLEPEFESFVGCTNTPLVYGMTPGEVSSWICDAYKLDIDLRVARMAGYDRGSLTPPGSPPWVPPSVGIRSPESAACYPITVVCEALPALDCFRAGLLPFQVIGATWIHAEELADACSGLNLPGIEFHPFWYMGVNEPYIDRFLNGIRVVITDPSTVLPITTMVNLLSLLLERYGPATIWCQQGTREVFFDKLMGTKRVRERLQQGADPAEIVGEWSRGIKAFGSSREKHLLYPPTPQDTA